MPLKPDADEILEYMRHLPTALRLQRARRWWPRYLYRSDHVENAARILNSGVLLSRASAERRQWIVKDSGSPQHLAQATERQRQYVRLYFRPRTPTQYANEGVRPHGKIQYDAHMPVPVYLLFSFRLLAEEGTLFTKGRLMSLSEVGRTADFLRRIEFTNVYHDSGVGVPGSDRRALILNARHAEVLVANLLSLDHLRFVVCRSQAERDTLLSLLDGSTRSLWIRKIVVDEGPRRLFYRRATYVNGVSLAADSSRFEFSADSEVAWRGPFDLRIEWTSGDWRVAYSDRNFVASAQPLQISLRTERSHYVAKLTLNGDLVYLGTFHQTYGFDLPF